MNQKLALILMFLIPISIFSQEAKKNRRVDLAGTIGMDLASRYIWRGVDYGQAINIQPYLEGSLYKKGFLAAIGAWGSYGISESNPNETDLYLTLGYSDKFDALITFTDYAYVEFEGGYDYFDYKKNHAFETMLSITGPSKVPLGFIFAINVWNQQALDPDNSYYVELNYTIKDLVTLFVGGAKQTGWYSADPDVSRTTNGRFGIINTGLTVSKDINIKNKISLPLNATLGANPSAKKFFFTVGIGISN